MDRMQDYRDARVLLERREEEFTTLERRAKLFLRAKQNLTIDDDWVRAQTLFGITTYYRREGDGSLSIKLEGHLTGIPLFEQLAVLREADLYHSWAPFCVASSRLAQLGKIDVVAWFLTGLPQFGLSRDACFRAIGCDSMREDGSILLVGEGLGDRVEDGVDVTPCANGGDGVASASGDDRQRPSGGGGGSPARRVDRDVSGSIHNESSNYSNWATLSDEYEHGSYLSRDSVLGTIQIPPVPTKFGSGRMTIRSFQGVIDVLSPSSAKTRLITNIDPNLSFIPQSLIDYCMKKLCGILLSRLQGAARTILKDPVNSLHARRMREDAQFYRMWLLPKFRSYCEDLGWELPPVAAFNVSEEDLDEEEWLLYSQLNRRQGDKGDDVRRTKSGAVIGDTTIERGRGERATSLDGQPTSRRLFSSTDSVSGRDRTVASAPVALQVQGNGEGMRTKLRQLLPSESMEIALTRPDLLQRWEQRQAKKKALEVASARRRAALRLRPSQPTEEQAKRLAQLKEAKERFLVGKKNSTTQVPVEEATRRGIIDDIGQDAGTRSASTVIIEFLSFTHPSIPHKVALPICLAVMFVLYHADSNLFHWNIEGVGLSGVDCIGDGRLSYLRCVLHTLAHNAIFLAVLVLYSMIHWIVTNLALVVAFDFIEFPLLSLAGTKRELENAKALYTRNVRTITAFLSMAIPVLVISSCLLSYLWNHSVSTVLPKAQKCFSALFVSVSSSVRDKAENIFHLDSIPSLIAQVARRVGNFIGAFFFVIRWLHSFLLRLWHWATLELFLGFGSSVRGWICSCLVTLFAVDSDHLNESWREETLDKSKIIFSYSSAFLFSFIAIAHIVFPTYKSSGKAAAHPKKEDVVVNTAGTPKVVATTTGSPASFSLASGEINENSPAPALRLRAATRSLASISSNGTDTSKSRKLRFGRKQAANKISSNKISSIRSV